MAGGTNGKSGLVVRVVGVEADREITKAGNLESTQLLRVAAGFRHMTQTLKHLHDLGGIVAEVIAIVRYVLSVPKINQYYE